MVLHVNLHLIVRDLRIGAMLECQLCGNFVPYYYRNITGPLQHMPIIDRLKNAELQKKDHITANDLNATLIEH